MKDSIFLLVKVSITTTHSNIRDVITELHTKTRLSITSTQKVEVLGTKIIPLNTKK